jgi:hypothetical protein
VSRPNPPSAAHWREVHRLFDAALAQPSRVRAAWLATSGAAVAFREGVMALLAGDATLNTLLDHPLTALFGAPAG